MRNPFPQTFLSPISLTAHRGVASTAPATSSAVDVASNCTKAPMPPLAPHHDGCDGRSKSRSAASGSECSWKNRIISRVASGPRGSV